MPNILYHKGFLKMLLRVPRKCLKYVIIRYCICCLWHKGGICKLPQSWSILGIEKFRCSFCTRLSFFKESAQRKNAKKFFTISILPLSEISSLAYNIVSPEKRDSQHLVSTTNI